METCSHCGATMTDDATCASCGAARSDGEEPPETSPASLQPAEIEHPAAEIDAAEETDGDGAEETEEPPTVPAGTWASTTSETESHPTMAPEPFGEPDTRRVRRVRGDEPSERIERGNGRSARTGARAESLSRARSRGLAVAPAEDTQVEPSRPEGRVVAFPGARVERAAGNASASSSGMRMNVPADVLAASAPPKWLASEILRDRIPAEPYGWTSRVLGVIAGVAGAAAGIVLGAADGPDLGTAGLFAVIAALAMTPIKFALRSGGFAVLGSIGLVIATGLRTTSVEGEAIGLATMGTTLLAAAQLMRVVHRTSRFARAAMALGLVVTATWLALGGGLDAMVVRSLDVDAWLGPAMRAALLIVVALSVLGFLDDSGTSGCMVWPWLVLGWSGLEAAVAIATGGTDQVLATVATPLFAVIAALGWMQVWATTPGLGVKETGRAKGDG